MPIFIRETLFILFQDDFMCFIWFHFFCQTQEQCEVQKFSSTSSFLLLLSLKGIFKTTFLLSSSFNLFLSALSYHVRMGFVHSWWKPKKKKKKEKLPDATTGL